MSRRRGEIITFYSFKGGVGRSMAVANVATILAQHGKKVLVLDFDFEAPGLHRYFLRALEGKHKTRRFEPDRQQRGVIDLFKALRKRLRARLPPETYDPEDPASQRELRAIVGEVLEPGGYGYRIHLRNPNRKNGSATLDFIAAGRFDERYVERVRSFGWKRFYGEYAEIFPILADDLAKRYDYVLVDSRTGFTDVGSICTMVLPDKLVLVFSPNEQSLAGALEVGEQAARQRASTADREPLALFPLISRLEDSEEDLKRQWVARATSSFERLSKGIYALKRCDLEVYFDLARVPHRPYYAYGERIAAEKEKQRVAGSMAQGFKLFADCLEYEYAHEVRALPKRQEAEAERAVLERLDDEPSLREMIARNPDEVLLRFRLAELLRMQGRWGEAVEIYDEIVSKSFDADDSKVSNYAASALLMKADACSGGGQFRDALDALDDWIRRFDGVTGSMVPELAARALVSRGIALGALKRTEDAVAAYDEVVLRFGDATGPALQESVADALFNKGFALGELRRVVEAVVAYDEVVQRFGNATGAALQRQVARALVNKGIDLDEIKRVVEAIAVCDEVVRRFGDATDPVLQESVVRALVSKGSYLGKLRRHEEAIAACDDVVQRFGETTDPVRQESVADALFNKGVVFGKLRRYEEAIAAHDEVVRRFGDASEPVLRERVASALVNKGGALRELRRYEEVIAVYDEVVRRFGKATELELRTQVARALVNKGAALAELKRVEEAIAAHDEVTRRFGDAAEPALREWTARALVNKGIYLGGLNRAEEAIAACDEVMRRFGDASDLALREQVAWALGNKEATLGNLKRAEEAIAVCDEVVRRFGDAAEPVLRERVAAALGNKGAALRGLARPDEAIAAYDEVVRRFGDATDPMLRSQIAGSLINKGAALHALARQEEELAAYDEVVRRFGDATEPVLREHVAGALNGIGFDRLCEAKRVWQHGDPPGADRILREAEARIAAARERAPENPIILGNSGYIAFLLGRIDEARAFLGEAIQRGGEDVRQAELADAAIHPLPQDEAFCTLVRSL